MSERAIFQGTFGKRIAELEWQLMFANFEARYIPEPNSGCWLWIGAYRNSHAGAYGAFCWRGRYEAAHRFAFQLLKGRIPRGLLVRHKCDNRSCVNPAHLLLGTYRDNLEDMRSRGRMRRSCGDDHWSRKNKGARAGEHNPRAVLSAEDVAFIRSSWNSGPQLAEQFGVTTTTIYRIRRGALWPSK